MSGYYVPSSFSANHVANKKNDDGTYKYDSAVNKVGIDAQRNLQQLNKQYNVTINQAYAQNLMANRGLRASSLGSGYKDAFIEKMQTSVSDEINQASLSVHDAKQGIFANLGKDLSQIAGIQQQETDNMRRMAGSLEQYHGYLSNLDKFEGGTKYGADRQFKLGDGFSFEDNYDKLLNPELNNKGSLAGYLDENSAPGLALEDWLRQNSGNSDAWLDWAYGGGLADYREFSKTYQSTAAPTTTSTPTTRPKAPLIDKTIWEALRASLDEQRLTGGGRGSFGANTSAIPVSIPQPNSSDIKTNSKEAWEKFKKAFYDGKFTGGF